MSDAVEDDDRQTDAVLDESEKESVPHRQFHITSYGADYPVEVLVSRITKGDFYIPPFQRAYVWSLPQASRFIESLLLGLPIPSLFLFRETESNRHLIIDGQQRLRTLQYFRDGLFKDRAFRLVDVAEPWVGKGYDMLAEEDRRRFDDALIHAIIFKQEMPESDNSSIYEVFERLNSGGIKLSPQEIRVCVSHGKFVQLLNSLNENKDWRAVFGPQSKRGKDAELILRFLALSEPASNYERPMRQFLDRFLHQHRSASSDKYEEFASRFERSIARARAALGDKAFRPERNLNAAVFDSVMVAIWSSLNDNPVDVTELKARYDKLLQDKKYIEACSASTSNEEQVKLRLSLANSTLGAK
jgi:hypothetical protein